MQRTRCSGKHLRNLDLQTFAKTTQPMYELCFVITSVPIAEGMTSTGMNITSDISNPSEHPNLPNIYLGEHTHSTQYPSTSQGG